MANEEKKDVSVNFKDRVKVYSTDKDKHRPTGQGYDVHPIQAEKLVESGKASKEPVDGSDNTEGGGKKTKKA